MSTSWRKATCPSCHQPVIWAFTESGKRMPVDPVPSERGTIALSGPMPRAIVMSQRGREPGQTLYVVHFDGCAKAEQHRKKTPTPQGRPPAEQDALFGGGR